MVAVLTIPLVLVATTVRTLSPSTKGTGIEKLPELWGAGIPFTVRVAAGSLTVPLTVTGVRFVTLRFVGEVIVTCGAGAYVKLRVEEVEFPATSVAWTRIEFAP